MEKWRRGWDFEPGTDGPYNGLSSALDGVPGAASLQHRSPVFCVALSPGSLKVLETGFQ